MNNTFRVRSNNRSRRRRIHLRRRIVQLATKSNSTSSSDLEPADHNDYIRFSTIPRPIEEDSSLTLNEHVPAIQESSDTEEPIDQSPSICPNSSYTVNQTINCLLRFVVDVHLDKHRTDQLLRMIKSIIPSPNQLPNRLSKVLKLLGHSSIFSAKYLCLNCDSLLIQSDTFRHHSSCPNTRCQSSRSTLRSNEITEIVTLDIRAALSSIINRNIELFQKHVSLFPVADPIHFRMYQHHQENLRDDEQMRKEPFINTITLIIHVDGAPLIRTTKQSLWPCYASIVELPPPCREFQRNIMTIALWSSCKKPDVDVFLDESLSQLRSLISSGTTVFVGNKEFRIVLRTQCFIADMPAKSLFLKFINFNGRNACSDCESTGHWSHVCGTMLYPYEQNNYQPRSHEDVVRIGEQAQNHGRSINGIKGLSPLLSIFSFPDQIIHDYMHLICINHLQALVKRWKYLMTELDLRSIGKKIMEQRVPHNIHVKFNFDLKNSHEWKAKHGRKTMFTYRSGFAFARNRRSFYVITCFSPSLRRLFILHIGVPLLINHLPRLNLSHFAIYSLAIRYLHAPHSEEEITFAERLLHLYCQSAPNVFNTSIELLSLHVHLHLPKQVRLHRGLAFHSAFAFESAIRHTKKKAHGTRRLASQISYWTDIETLVHSTSYSINESRLVDLIKADHSRLVEFKRILIQNMHMHHHSLDNAQLYKRYQRFYVTFHSLVYDKAIRCISYIVSYSSNQNGSSEEINYGDCVLFYSYGLNHFAFVRRYRTVPDDQRISSFVDLPRCNNNRIQKELDRTFCMVTPSNKFDIIPVKWIRHKCVSVPVHSCVCLTEIRVDFEHD